MKDHSDVVNVGGISEQIIMVHLLVRKLHGHCEGGVICVSCFVVEVVCQPVHSSNNSSNSGQIL